MSVSDEVVKVRQEKDSFFRVSDQSPLSDEQRRLFTGLRYYDYDPTLDLTVTPVQVEGNRSISIQTSSGDLRIYQRHSRFTFSIDGQEVALTIYEAPHGYFLPFADADAGTETYPAGRYLEPEPLAEGRFRINFNDAYNPYCAYAEPVALAAAAGQEPRQWSCPITPSENRIPVSIRAGEKLPQGEWVEHA